MIYKTKFHFIDVLSFFLIFSSSSAYAVENHPYLGGTIALSSTKIGKSNHSINYYDGNLTDDYPTQDSRSNKMLIGVNAGYEFAGEEKIPAIALGLGLYTTPINHKYTGRVIETATGDPSFALYAYKYKIETTRMMVETQFTWAIGKVLPFINLGAGLAWNHTKGYKETPLHSIGYVPVPAFQSRTSTNFAYQLGFGVSYDFNFPNGTFPCQNERISLGYRFVNLGDASFGTRGVEYPYRLKLGRLKSNELYLTYTHLF